MMWRDLIDIITYCRDSTRKRIATNTPLPSIPYNTSSFDPLPQKPLDVVEIYDSIPEAREYIASSKDEGVDINSYDCIAYGVPKEETDTIANINYSDCIAYGVPKKETDTIANINYSDCIAYDVGPNVNIEILDAEDSTRYVYYETMKEGDPRK